MHSGDFRVLCTSPAMVRSFRTDIVYAPGPTCPDDANNSMTLYAAYRATDGGLFPCKSTSFIDYARTHHVVNGVVKRRPIAGGGHNTGKESTAVGCVLAMRCMINSSFISVPCFPRTTIVKLLFQQSFRRNSRCVS